MDKIGIGVLSHAHGHINTYCGVMQGFVDVDLISCWDDNKERGERAAKNFDLEYCGSPGDVLSDPRVHAVLIGSETNRHADHVEMAAEAGKHILLQKPMATTLDDCDRIISAVAKRGIKFSMAFQMRQDPVNQKIKSLLEENAVGNVAVVRRRHAINVLLNPDFVNGPTNWHLDPVANIGMFFDDATHAADWFYWLLGDPLSVIAEIGDIVTHESPDDNGVATYRFRNGVIGILFNSSTTVAGVNTTEIYGDEGTIIQDFGDAPSTAAPRSADASALKLIHKRDTDWTDFKMEIPASQGDRIAAIPRPFVDYIRGLTEVTVSAEEGRKSVEMVLGAYQANREGRRVTFPLSNESK
jgi:predicted dehydrogenase